MAKVKKGCCNNCSDSCNQPFSCNSTIPSDANSTCPNGYTKTDCVTYSGETDDCIGIANKDILTSVIRKLIAFIKQKVQNIASNSMVVTTYGDCTKTAKIEIVPSSDSGNTFILGTDGKPYVPASNEETPITAVDSITIDFTTSGTGNHTITGVVKVMELLQVINNNTEYKNYFCQMVNSCIVPPSACPAPTNLTLIVS